MSLNNSSIFCWNILPDSVVPSGSLIHQYLPNGQENVVKYDDFHQPLDDDIQSWHLWAWYIWTPVNLQSSHLVFGPCGFVLSKLYLITLDLSTTWLFQSLWVIKWNCSTILMSQQHPVEHLFAASVAASALLSLASALHQLLFLGNAWYGWLPSFTCKETVHSKHPIPEKR